VIIHRLKALDGARHPRLVGGDLRLALLRCMYEACEQDAQYEQALQFQQQWGETKARIRGRLAAEHGQWTTQALAAWRSEADDVVKTALREPLRRAAGKLHALQAASGMEAEAATSLDRARHSVDRAVDIADQYLGVMRAEHLRQEDMQVIDLSALVDDVCEQMAPPGDAGVALVRAIEPQIHVRGDRVLLMRALGNLLSNAFKRSADVWLRVSDRGPGMTLDMRARLFQRFATGAVRKGNGLGLAMVARVARLHGARIDLNSEPGLGTEVGLLLERTGDG
jgi:signal transduction histidine kinase